MLPERIQVDVARRCLEKHVDRFSEETDGARNYQGDDEERRERVGYLAARHDVGEGGDDHRDRCDDVREHVEVRGTYREPGVRIAQEGDRDRVAYQTQR